MSKNATLLSEQKGMLSSNAMLYTEQGGDRWWLIIFVPNEAMAGDYEQLAAGLMETLKVQRRNDATKQFLYARHKREGSQVDILQPHDHLEHPEETAYTDRAIVLQGSGAVPSDLSMLRKQRGAEGLLDNAVRGFISQKARELLM